LLLNVLRLIANRDLGETRKIDEGEGEDVGGEDSKVDGDWGDAGILASLGIGFSDDFVPYL
jgi:hypothetical protein